MEMVQQNSIPADHAARFGALPVQFRGRVMPMNTFTAEILRKVSKSQSVGKLNSDQFLLGLLSMPQMWMQVPFIALPDEQISIQYNLPKEYAPYALFLIIRKLSPAAPFAGDLSQASRRAQYSR